MLIAQVTDTHIRPAGMPAFELVDTGACLERTVAALLDLRPLPDVVLLSGDLVDFGRQDEYARLSALLAPLHMPVYPIPGNHDDRKTLRAAFPALDGLAGEEFIQYVVEDWPVRLIALDTLIPGKVEGELCRERLAWLDARLAERPDRPTVIFMHHPPFATGIGPMDATALRRPERLGAVIARHGQVERILCGHVHRAVQTRFHGTIASICPSSAHQIALDLRAEAPLGMRLEPPAFQVHAWQEAGLVSHTVPVGDFPGPWLFQDLTRKRKPAPGSPTSGPG